MRPILGYRLLVVTVLLGCLFFYGAKAEAAPLLANYYLGTLPTDQENIKKLARNALLILSPEQATVRRQVIAEIRKINPSIILLAYVPSESYNSAWEEYPANTLFSDFRVDDDWWLRDTSGNIISDWPNLKNTDMSREWCDYLLGFTRDKILSANIWDGIFWDMIYDGISGVNRGDLDMNRDGQRDDPKWANAEWVNRINYFLDKSRNLSVRYIVINGSSIRSMQQFVNGRMYENFPTPWEKNGSWSGLMSGLSENQSANRTPQLYVFNANTNNTGKSDDYKRMRFGIASSLLLDNVYFSFDYGTTNHAQVWSYDEYDVSLGDPVGQARSQNNYSVFKDDVWRRDYNRGLAIVNPTAQAKEIDLGGDYEKVFGKQDPDVNDGTIVSSLKLASKDGLIMLKTFQSLSGIPFTNGGFARFYDREGHMARNGLFTYAEKFSGGAKVFQGDINGDAAEETVVADGPKLRILNSRGQSWFSYYPFGGNYTGRLNFSVGKTPGQQTSFIILSGDRGGRAVLYNYHGAVINEEIAPLGKKYYGGFSVASGNLYGNAGNVILGWTDAAGRTEIIIYNDNAAKVLQKIVFTDKAVSGKAAIAAGDIDGDGLDEVIAKVRANNKETIRIFDSAGKLLNQFKTTPAFGGAAVDIGALDVNFDGKDEIVLMNSQ